MVAEAWSLKGKDKAKMADKLTEMPVETFQKLLGLEHRIKDIWIDPYLKSITIILDPTHDGPPEYRTTTGIQLGID